MRNENVAKPLGCGVRNEKPASTEPKADRDRRLCPKATATLTFVNHSLIAAWTERACPKTHHSRFLSWRFLHGFSAQSQSESQRAESAVTEM